jgi:hypothetical protein
MYPFPQVVQQLQNVRDQCSRAFQGLIRITPSTLLRLAIVPQGAIVLWLRLPITSLLAAGYKAIQNSVRAEPASMKPQAWEA